MKVPSELDIDSEKAIAYGIDWTRNYFKNAGIKTGVIGISGGSDSALTAYITARAIGKENVIGLLLPEDEITPKEDIDHAEGLIKSIGIRRAEINITDFVNCIIRSDQELLKVKNRIAYANIKARIRMVLLYKEANKNNALVVGTDDRSEHILGYYTKYGDGGVDINVPEYLYKTQVRKLLEYISEKENMPVMKEIAEKKPSPRLWAGQTAEGELNMEYDVVDRVFYYLKDVQDKLSAGEISKKISIDEETVEKLIKMEKSNKHKDDVPPAPPVNYNLNPMKTSK